MDKRYVQAIKTGLICGVAVAVVLLILGLAGVWLNSTPAMKAYQEQVMQPYHDMWSNGTYEPAPTYPYYKMPQPPLESYVASALSLITLALEIIGLLVAGALGIRSVGQPKYSLKDTAYLGCLAGLGWFIPVFVVMVIMMVITVLTSPTMTELSSVMPMASGLIPVITVLETFCCCLPVGLVLAAVIAVLGAGGYVLFTGKLE